MSSSSSEPKTYFAFTADVDPDVNLPVFGQIPAVSHPVEMGKIRFSSCAAGLEYLIDILTEVNIKATFFFEARSALALKTELGLDIAGMMYDHEVGSHSYRHEDFLGKETGIVLNHIETADAIQESLMNLRDIFQKPIVGFRAPYVRINELLAKILTDFKFRYDSSVTGSWNLDPGPAPGRQREQFQPYYYFEDTDIPDIDPRALIEVPIPTWILPDGKNVSSYLWPVLEGDLDFSYYAKALELVAEMPPSNFIVIMATHPWHLVETYNSGMINEAERRRLSEALKSVLISLKEKPHVEFVTISQYIEMMVD
ncbi:MAG: polysaccharide deacetylase family protein [Thermoplasmata archaeon]|nr:MAG: polysaccharide deacetylase family protein [Thermoplasmata archaeon]